MNKKQVFLSLETAKELYNSGGASRKFALDNYSEDELKAKVLPMKWEDIKNLKGYYIDHDSTIRNVVLANNELVKNYNIFPTESLAKGALALAQLLQLRDKWNEGIDLKLNDTDIAKSCIYFNNFTRSFEVGITYNINILFIFKNSTTTRLFLDTFKELLWEAREYV